jgi:aspartate kinase
MSFTMDSKRLPTALLADLERIADVTCEGQHAIICLVGEDIHGKPGIAASVFDTVANAQVNIRMNSQGASEINISFVIRESDVPRAVQHLHARFFTHGDSAGRAAKFVPRKQVTQLAANGHGGGKSGKRAVGAPGKTKTRKGN